LEVVPAPDSVRWLLPPITIRPSPAWSSTPEHVSLRRRLGSTVKSVVSFPSPLKLASSPPPVRYRATAQLPSMVDAVLSRFTSLDPVTTIRPSAWMATARPRSELPSRKSVRSIPSPSNEGSRVPSARKRTTAKSLSALPATTIRPSSWIAMSDGASEAEPAGPGVAVAMPSPPKVGSSAPDCVKRRTKNSLVPGPATTILPSAWMASVWPRPPCSLVTMPPVPNVGSRFPSESKRARKKRVVKPPLTTSLPSGWTARSRGLMKMPFGCPSMLVSTPSPLKVASRMPLWS
jgi:hypothetical protein